MTNVRKIAGVRNVVHAEIDPQGEVLLIERLAVDELFKVDDGILRVVVVPGVGATRLRVLLARSEERVGAEILGVEEVGRVRDGQVHSCAAPRCRSVSRSSEAAKRQRGRTRHDAVALILAKLVLLVLVDDVVESLTVGAPILRTEVRDLAGTSRVLAHDLRVIFVVDVGLLDLHGGSRVRVPAVGNVARLDGVGGQTILRAEDVDIDLVVEDVVVHRSRERVVDVVACRWVPLSNRRVHRDPQKNSP